MRTTKRFVTARAGWIALVTLVVVVGAALFSWSRTPSYSSTAEVVVESSIGLSTNPQPPDMGTEKSVASSGVVVALAASRLHLQVATLKSGLSVSVPLNTHILNIGYAAGDPNVARARAEAIAQAYVEYWASRQPKPGGSASVRSVLASAPKSSIITPAGLAGAPSSPNHPLDIGIGVVVGLLFGFLTALLRDRIDDRLRGAEDLEARTGVALLARLPALRYRRTEPAARLVTVRAPDSAAADRYRDLRTHVLRAATRRGAKAMLVTCPAGEAKTVVAANLAVSLAQADKRIVLVCADTDAPYGHDLFGLPDEDEACPTLRDARSDIAGALRYTGVAGLRLLPASSFETDRGALLQSAAFQRALGQLRGSADLVIIDGPPVLVGADAGALAELTEMTLLVTDARRSTRRQLDAALRQLEHTRQSLIGCVLDNTGRRHRVRASEAVLAPDGDAPDALFDEAIQPVVESRAAQIGPA